MARGARIAALAVVGAFAARAEAHQVGLSRGEYAFDGRTLRAEITFARGELLSIAPALDTDRSGVLSAAELAGGRAALEGAVVARVAASVAGASCRGAFARARLTEEDGAAVTVAFSCPPGKAARVELPILEELEHGHRHVARAHTLAGETEEVLFRGHAGFDVGLGPPLAPLPVDAAAPPSAEAKAGGATRGGAFAEAFACALAVALGGEDIAGRAALLASFAAGVVAGHGAVALGWLAPPPLVSSVVAALTLVPAGVALAAPRASRGPRGAWAAAASLGLVHGVVSSAGSLGLVAVAAAVSLVVALAIATLKRPLPARAFAILGALVAIGGVADAAVRLSRP